MHESHDDPSRSLTEMWPALHQDLLRYVTSLTGGDVYAAEDVVQEAWMRLWQHREVLMDGLPLEGWLRTVARNILVDRVRRRRARPPEVAFGPDADGVGVGTDEFALVDACEITEHILSALSASHRAVVQRVYVRDRPVAEVASELGVPVGTVKSRCHAALRQLRASLIRPRPAAAGSPGPSTRASHRSTGTKA